MSICSVCDCEGAELACTSHCMSYFHLDCLGLVEEPSFKFLCDECLVSSGTCLLAGREMGRAGNAADRNAPSGVRVREQAVPNREITCHLHVCARCVSIGVSSIEYSTQLLQCVRCPLALHKAVR